MAATLCTISVILLALPSVYRGTVDVFTPTAGFCSEEYSRRDICFDAPADASLHRGWPVNLNSPGAGFPYTPTLYDMDGNGTCEIFLTGGHTFGLSGDGSFLTGWPTEEMAYMGYATNDQMPGPSCADINNDGITEVMWSERDWYAGSAHMWTFNGKRQDGSNLPGFPQTAPGESSNALDSPFVLGDSDGDGFLEAVTAHTLGNTGDYYRISALDHNGDYIFTTDLDPAENIQCIYFGDADGNGNEEFFAVTVLSGHFRLHLLDSSGGEQAGYPVNLFSLGAGYLMFGPPVAADLDNNGDLEIILGYGINSTSYAAAVNHDGTAVTGFPITVATGSQLFYLGLGDITDDEQPELLAFDNQLSAGYRAWAIDIATGTPLPGWPFILSDWPEGFPTVVDVNNDGCQDICFVTSGGFVHGLSNDGTELNGFPKTMNSGSISGAAAGDIDGDSLYELVAATWDGWVYAWDTDGVVSENNCDWPMRGIDSRNTGIFRGAEQSGVQEADPQVSLCISSNPVTGSALFTVSGTACSTSVEIFDITGKRVAETTSCWTPGTDAHNGVYFARLTGYTGTPPVKFILVR